MGKETETTRPSGSARRKFREVDPEFDAIETLYGVGYRYRES